MKAKRSLFWALVLAAALALPGCLFMVTGSNYGAIHSDSELSYASIGGFPSGGLTFGTYYSVPSGTHDVYYVAKYGSLYYPGNAFGTGSLFFSTDYLYHYSYSVYGEARYFDLYLNYTGLGYSGADSVVGKSLGGGQLTLTREIVKVDPELFASLPVSVLSAN
jgi:hypothetical protein